MIEVWLGKALLCIAGTCHPVLVGDTTPTGTFPLVEASTPKYGTVLVFARDSKGGVFAIHKPPTERRRALLQGDSRTGITLGCINVPDAVYERLRGHNRVRINP